jgi:hypothetical protein
MTDLTYTIDGKQRKKPAVNTGPAAYNTNDQVYIWHNPLDPDNIEANHFSSWIGWVVIILALFIVIYAWLNVYTTQHFEIAAAAQGASSVIDTVIPTRMMR